MYIRKIEWFDQQGEEAVLEVAADKDALTCFSCPCPYRIGDRLREPLECLDIDDMVSCDTKGNDIEKINGTFAYQLKGKMKDVKNGIIEVYGFVLKIDTGKIPGDITNGMYVQFITSRIDVW